mmetsp:Transcript_20850/g.60696  ORF Transcript_20850/g.60696 Transcript_20850/m.60696 type:complete len:118 (-) Transcript_20850:443-796(-)|eukprot:CAMPEP_0113534346 /NCGR_PEP_ID=MMETSP0015_2-20120614/5110_1 /TAXON_ID=2838 /ORGANISM="Odontella" /LENGTH=117 /DNA_ID=CAMNT_0000433501 /DNA_START=272 /DNA_END=625 /DNA_ORIENTATION=- /assembly_acc=CAM_ASM_000160
MSPLRSFAVLLFAAVAASTGSAFTLAPGRTSSRWAFALGSSSGGDDGENPIECYITNEEGVLIDGEKPDVICTSDPEEYAWMEGVDPKKLVKTEGVADTTECVEGASPKGTPEWHCE